MDMIWLIFFGAGIGGVLRFLVAKSTAILLGPDFPYGTMIVNISGCFLMGLLFTLLLETINNNAPSLRAFLLIGLLGGYTTYSSFAIESLNLIENGNFWQASVNIIFTTFLSLIATWIGILGARSL